MTTPSRAKVSTLPTVTVNEATDLFPGEWILMRVSEFDEHHTVTRGEIVTHNRSHARVWATLGKRLSPPPEKPKDLYYLFHGFRHLHTGEAFREAIANAERLGDTGVRPRWR